MQNIFLSFLVILLTTYSQLVLRIRLHNKSETHEINIEYFLNMFADLWVFSAIGAFLLSFVCWSLALSNDLNATKAYPAVASLTIFFVSFMNCIIFQDKIVMSNFLGGGLIIFGIFLLLR